MVNQFDDKDINSIVRAMQHDKCVLFLGQEIFQNDENQNLHTAFLHKMVDEFGDEIEYNAKDDFLFYHESDVKNDVIFELMEFYEKTKCRKDYFKQLVQLPFHLIISLSPDTTIADVFDDYAIDVQFLDFEKRTEKECGEPSKENPVVYNLLGLGKKGNYILTQDDFYEYMKEVIANKRAIPTAIRSALNNARNYVFLGFNYDKWYMRLLMNVLDFHTIEPDKKRQVVSQTEQTYSKLAEKQFHLSFIGNNYEKFFEQLISKATEKELCRKLLGKCQRLEIKIEKKQKLIDQYEDQLITEDDPQRKMKYEDELVKLKYEMKALKDEYKNECQ